MKVWASAEEMGNFSTDSVTTFAKVCRSRKGYGKGGCTLCSIGPKESVSREPAYHQIVILKVIELDDTTQSRGR